MNKITRLLAAMVMISILALAGCSAINGSSSQPAPKILRQTQIGGKYTVYQIEVTLKAGTGHYFIIQLKDGEKADGYFYVEKGENNIGFTVAGASRIYQSDLKTIPTGQPASDRFTFTASQAQGNYYKMTLQNLASSGSNTSATIFLEVIYPGTELVSAPIEK